MKKIFGELNLTWVKVIIVAIVAGVYTAIVSMVPAFKDLSITDIGISFEVWILFGIIIIMNSKSALDSALKCFVFFLISQPLVYIVQDLVNHSNLFHLYYRNWILWTVACVPMGFFGYYMKKDKWWGLIILLPILLLLTDHYYKYLAQTLFSFPRHLFTWLFILASLIIYPLFIFNNKKIKTSGLIISILLIIAGTALVILKPQVYKTDIMVNGGNYYFDQNYKVYLKDERYGKVEIYYNDGIDDYMVKAEFKKAGKTKLILESPLGIKTTYDLTIEKDKFDIELSKTN